MDIYRSMKEPAYKIVDFKDTRLIFLLFSYFFLILLLALFFLHMFLLLELCLPLFLAFFSFSFSSSFLLIQSVFLSFSFFLALARSSLMRIAIALRIVMPSPFFLPSCREKNWRWLSINPRNLGNGGYVRVRRWWWLHILLLATLYCNVKIWIRICLLTCVFYYAVLGYIFTSTGYKPSTCLTVAKIYTRSTQYT